jgi:hypothetical protein
LKSLINFKLVKNITFETADIAYLDEIRNALFDCETKLRKTKSS